MALLLQLLLLLMVANGAPILAQKLFNDRFNHPLDGGLVLRDGRRLFGSSKTVRGIVLAIISTVVAAVLLDLPWFIGALIGTFAMLGDVLSSFTKRRLGKPTSSQALGLDQIPESLLPLLTVTPILNLRLMEIGGIVLAFLILELALSRILFKLNLRDRPY